MHTARARVGGMPGATLIQLGTDVVLHVWEWWVFKLEQPHRDIGFSHVVACTMATLCPPEARCRRF